MNIYFLTKFISIFLDILVFLLFIRVILSWIYPLGHGHHNRVVSFIFDTTEPLLKISRKLPHRIGMMDLSPIIAFIIIEVARYIILSLLMRTII